MKDALASTSSCPSFPEAVLDAFCHALQSPEAAAVFSPSLGVCLLLLIWGIAPGIKLHRFRHRSQKLFCRRHSGLYLSPNLLLAAFFLHTKDRHGKKKACRITSCTPLVRPCVQVHPSVRACVCERERKKRGERERECLGYSRCQKFCCKTSGKCKHVAMTTYLRNLGSIALQGSLSLPTGNHTS